MPLLKTIYRPFIIFVFAGLCLRCTSQVSNINTESDKITLISKISMPGIRGRIDHIAYDPINHLVYIAALGNNTIEVVNINTMKVVNSITGLNEPQGILYIPSSHTLVVANGGNGNCAFFDAVSYKQTGTVSLKNDADNIRYDTSSHFIYVGYGRGSIAVIDPISKRQVADIRLDDHPESFQISSKHNRLYINVPEAGQIEVADLSTNKITAKWKNNNASSNFPMALDEDNNRLFVAYRNPATLRMINSETGLDIYSASCSGDADDVFYKDSLVFVSTGIGYIDVFRTTQTSLTQVNHIKTSKGGRTSLLLAAEREILLAVPARGNQPAALWVYRIN
jgi:DNA-binding beta-propeller fold protein YncE